jgi:hypothetical protein
MKSNHEHKYSEISSFEDLRIEREHLIFRSRLIEAKLNLSYLHVRKIFSVSNLFVSFAKESILPRISEYLGVLIKKVGKESQPGSGNDQEGSK